MTRSSSQFALNKLETLSAGDNSLTLGTTYQLTSRISASGYYQHVVYRLVPADRTPGPGVGMPLGLVALNADVLSPRDGETVAAPLTSNPAP